MRRLTFGYGLALGCSALLPLTGLAEAKPADEGRGVAEASLYFGDLHNHSTFSDGAVGVPDLIAQAKRDGLDVLAISDHAEYLSAPFNETIATRPGDPSGTAPHHKWQETLEATRAGTDDSFVAIRGVEWSSVTEGHVNVWWSEQFTDSVRTPGASMRPLWTWLQNPSPLGGADGVAGFNHPGPKDGPLVFDDLAYSAEVDERVATMELFNEISQRSNDFPADYYEQFYVRALDNGWHVGAIGTSDNHGRSGFSNPAFPRSGIWATALTPEGIREAVEARRVYATQDQNLSVAISGNGAWMGSRLKVPAGEQVAVRVDVSDPDAGDDLARVDLITVSGEVVASRQPGSEATVWDVLVTAPQRGETWFVARIVQTDGQVAYSSPIWVKAKVTRPAR